MGERLDIRNSIDYLTKYLHEQQLGRRLGTRKS